jgi:hypothetical protein
MDAGTPSIDGPPYWALTDEQLLAQCDWYAGRASGRGGQKRNKTSSAIQMKHRPTGITSIANEARMQGENRTKALERLRHSLVMAERRPVDLETFEPPPELIAQRDRKCRLGVNPRNPRYLPILAIVLDLVECYEGQVAKAADRLGLTTSNLVGFFRDDPRAWTWLQELRKRKGLGPLK